MRGNPLSTTGGLLAGACSVLTGAGYALTPETGPAGVRFGAFGDAWIEPLVAVLGTAGGFAIVAATVWAALTGRASARVLATALIAGFVVAAGLGLWIWYRADPPLPPSWGWLRIPQTLGLAGALLWAGGLAGRPAGPRVGIPSV